MKKLLAIAMMMVAGVASADTLNLPTNLNCGKARVCGYTQLDGTYVYINDYTPGLTSVTVILGSTVYTAPLGNSNFIQSLTLTSADLASTITLSATFTPRKVLIRSGHNFYETVWFLTGGTIVR